jgi:hypothetical protein
MQRTAAVLTTMLLILATLATTAVARQLSDWSPVTNLRDVPGTSPELNTPALEGCPIESPDGLELFIASNRAGGVGGLDIWVARRARGSAPWGTPENLGSSINSPYNDFCPSPMRGNRFFFVSDRPSVCGDEPGRGADIYVSRWHPVRGFGSPQNVGCQVNSGAVEASPYYLEDEAGRAWLYFSSNRPSTFGSNVSNLYVSPLGSDGTFGPAELVPNVNTMSDDARPNLRRDGLEMVFDSNRPGGLGGADVYMATRSSVDHAWSPPVNLGPAINSEANDTRPSLSWDARTLYVGSNRFGSTPAGPEGPPSADIYVSHRAR